MQLLICCRFPDADRDGGNFNVVRFCVFKIFDLATFRALSRFGSDDTGSDAGNFKLLPRVVRVLGFETLQNLLILFSISACDGTVVHHALGVVTKQFFHDAG